MACTLLSTRICNGALYDERRIHSRKVERETLDERYTRIVSEESIAVGLSASSPLSLSLSAHLRGALGRDARQPGPTSEVAQRRISDDPDPPIRAFAPLRSRT